MNSRRSSVLDYGVLVSTLAVGGAVVGILRTPWAKEHGSWLWWLLLAVALAGGYALRRLERAIPDAQPPAKPAVVGSRPRRIAGVVLIAVSVALVGWVVAKLWPDFRRWHGTVLPWVISLASMLAGGWMLGAVGQPAVERVRRNGDRELPVLGRPEIPRSAEIAAFLLIAALAVFCRVYRIGSIPAGIYVDETNGALDSLGILEGSGISPFGTAWYENPAGFSYYMAGLFKLFGANYASMKAVSLIPSILAVLAIYPLGRLLFGPVAGLSAMLLMAVSRWHLTMSRWGWAETAPLVFQILATYFLIRGLREARAFSFAAGGVIAGLMAYTYLSSRIALATLAVFGLYWLLADPEGPIRSVRRHAPGFALFLLAALVALAPIVVTYVRNPFVFWNRMREISIFNEVRETHSYAPLVDNVVRHLKFFHQSGDLHGKHNLPGEPETDPVTGLLFVVGLGYAVWRFRDRRRGLLLIWVVFAMLAGILSVRHEAPQAFRTLATVPAIALLAGDVLARTARGPLWIGRRTSEEKPSRWNLRVGASAAILLLGLIAAAAWEIRVYFGRQADSIDVKSSFNLPENHAAHEVMDALEKGQEIYLSPREYEFSPLKFLVYGMMKKKAGINILPDPPYRLIRPEIDFPVPDHGKDVLLLLSTNYWPVRDYFLQFYPDAPIELAKGPGNIPLYVRMRLPRSMVAGLQGLHARLTHGDGRVEETIQPTPDSGGQALSAAEWTGGLRVEVSGSYDFPTDGNLKTTVDGEAWAGRRFLYRGFHDLRVALAAPGRPDPVRLSWTFPGGPAQPVPPQALFRVARPRVGLMGTYFRNTQWEGPPLFRQITPIILLAWNDRDSVEGGGFSARFTGSLRVTTPGSYAFHIEADDGARLTIDGRVLGEGLVPNQPNAFRTSATLTAGDHPIQIDYFQSGGGSVLEFFWQPPGEPELPVPPSALLPGE